MSEYNDQDKSALSAISITMINWFIYRHCVASSLPGHIIVDALKPEASIHIHPYIRIV